MGASRYREARKWLRGVDLLEAQWKHNYVAAKTFSLECSAAFERRSALFSRAQLMSVYTVVQRLLLDGGGAQSPFSPANS